MDDSLLVLLALFVVGSLRDPLDRANRALQKGGARAYEATHPDEKNHANDLPGRRLTKDQIVDLARDVGFPDPNLAAAVAMAESFGYVNALADVTADGDASHGLWQINTKHHPEYRGRRAELENPRANALAALKLSRTKLGWRHWSTYKTGKYRRFL